MRFGTACSFLSVLALAGCFSKPDPVPAPITIDPLTWLDPAPGGSLAQCQPVHPSMVREVPPPAVPQAVDYLSAQSAVPLTDYQMKRLLPASDIDRLVVAETAAIDSEDEADRREAIAADPVLTTPAYRQAAHSQRIEAGIRREQQPTLQPYLVRGLKQASSAGGYAVCEAGDALQVTHVSTPLPATVIPAPVPPDPMIPPPTVGEGAHGLEFKPLVVLLPAPPSVVYVGVTVAGEPRARPAPVLIQVLP